LQCKGEVKAVAVKSTEAVAAHTPTEWVNEAACEVEQLRPMYCSTIFQKTKALTRAKPEPETRTLETGVPSSFCPGVNSVLFA
jgi:Fe-S-cluster containining protein